MGRKNIYINEDDEQLWQRAEKLVQSKFAESVSKLVAEGLRKEVQRMEILEELREGIDRLVVSYEDRNGKFKKVAFNGKWLVEEESDERNSSKRQSIALTEKGQYIYFFKSELTGEGGYEIYESFEEMTDKVDEGGPSSSILAGLADEIGEDYVEFLDI